MKVHRSLVQTGIWARFQVFGISLRRLSESYPVARSLENRLLMLNKTFLEAEIEC